MLIYYVIEESIHLYMNSCEWHYTKGIVAEILEKFKKEIFLDLIYRYNHHLLQDFPDFRKKSSYHDNNTLNKYIRNLKDNIRLGKNEEYPYGMQYAYGRLMPYNTTSITNFNKKSLLYTYSDYEPPVSPFAMDDYYSSQKIISFSHNIDYPTSDICGLTKFLAYSYEKNFFKSHYYIYRFNNICEFYDEYVSRFLINITDENETAENEPQLNDSNEKYNLDISVSFRKYMGELSIKSTHLLCMKYFNEESAYSYLSLAAIKSFDTFYFPLTSLALTKYILTDLPNKPDKDLESCIYDCMITASSILPKIYEYFKEYMDKAVKFFSFQVPGFNYQLSFNNEEKSTEVFSKKDNSQHYINNTYDFISFLLVAKTKLFDFFQQELTRSDICKFEDIYKGDYLAFDEHFMASLDSALEAAQIKDIKLFENDTPICLSITKVIELSDKSQDIKNLFLFFFAEFYPMLLRTSPKNLKKTPSKFINNDTDSILKSVPDYNKLGKIITILEKLSKSNNSFKRIDIDEFITASKKIRIYLCSLKKYLLFLMRLCITIIYYREKAIFRGKYNITKYPDFSDFPYNNLYDYVKALESEMVKHNAEFSEKSKILLNYYTQLSTYYKKLCDLFSAFDVCKIHNTLLFNKFIETYDTDFTEKYQLAENIVNEFTSSTKYREANFNKKIVPYLFYPDLTKIPITLEPFNVPEIEYNRMKKLNIPFEKNATLYSIKNKLEFEIERNKIHFEEHKIKQQVENMYDFSENIKDRSSEKRLESMKKEHQRSIYKLSDLNINQQIYTMYNFLNNHLDKFYTNRIIKEIFLDLYHLFAIKSKKNPSYKKLKEQYSKDELKDIFLFIYNIINNPDTVPIKSASNNYDTVTKHYLIDLHNLFNPSQSIDKNADMTKLLDIYSKEKLNDQIEYLVSLSQMDETIIDEVEKSLFSKEIHKHAEEVRMFIELPDFPPDINTKIQDNHKNLFKVLNGRNGINRKVIVFKLDLSEELSMQTRDNVINISNDDKISSLIAGSPDNTLFISYCHPELIGFSYSDILMLLLNNSVKGISLIGLCGRIHILYKNKEFDLKKATDLLISVDSIIDFTKNCYKVGMIYKFGGILGE